jgi:hypothetical protein
MEIIRTIKAIAIVYTTAVCHSGKKLPAPGREPALLVNK